MPFYHSPGQRKYPKTTVRDALDGPLPKPPHLGRLHMMLRDMSHCAQYYDRK